MRFATSTSPSASRTSSCGPSADDRPFDLVNPHTGQSAKQLGARSLFDLIVNAAWRTGDPGLIFLDQINRRNPTPELGSIEATNPCGEVPLLPYESCILASINLDRMTKDHEARRAHRPGLGRLGQAAGPHPLGHPLPR